MAKRKRSSRRPQPKHKKQKKSQHDKRKRLQRRNPQLAEKYAWEFRTKHQLGVELLKWFMQSIRELGLEAKVWLAVDGAYATRPFLLPVLGLDIVVVSRLRKDACLYDLPGPRPPHRRGPDPIYGKNKIGLAKRAAHRQGWQTITYRCRDEEVTRQYKTFLATSKLVSAQIRVVIVRFEDGGWAPYFCTDTAADVREILEAMASRWAIEALSRREGGVGRGAATSSQRLVESGVLAPESVAVCVGRVVLLGSRSSHVDRPPRPFLGQPRPPPLAC
jgi:hypothetical protein